MTQAALRSVFYRGAGRSFVLRLASVIAMFAAHALLARTMGAADYGVYAYALQLVALFAVIGGLGLPQAALRVVPESVVDGDRGRLTRFVSGGLCISVLVGAVLALLGALAASTAGRALPDSLMQSLAPVTLLLLPAFIALRFAQEVMRGAKDVVASQLPEQIILPVGLVLAVGFAATLGLGLSARDALGLHLGVVALGLAYVLLRVRAVQVDTGSAHHAPDAGADGMGAWLAIGIPLAVAAISSLLLKRADFLILGLEFPAEVIAPYAAAVRIAGLMVFGLYAANAISAAMLGEAWRRRDLAELQTGADRAVGLATLFSLPALAIFLVLPEKLLLLFGPDYVAAADVLRILALGQFVNSLTGPVGPLLMVTGQQRFYMLVIVGSAIASVAVLVLIIPIYGPMGAAFGASAGVMVANAALAVGAYRRLGIRTYVRPHALREISRDLRTFGARKGRRS